MHAPGAQHRHGEKMPLPPEPWGQVPRPQVSSSDRHKLGCRVPEPLRSALHVPDHIQTAAAICQQREQACYGAREWPMWVKHQSKLWASVMVLLCVKNFGEGKRSGERRSLQENPTYSKTFTTYCWGPVNAGTVSTRYTSSQSLKKLL
jgi:hypothetical protein